VNSPEFLTNLPLIVFLWTCLSLSWGVCIRVLYTQMIAYRNSKGIFRRTRIDLCNSRFILLANIVLIAYLLIEPFIQSYAGESFIIINIFYNAYLVTASNNIYNWWKRKTLKEHQKSLDVDHLLT